MGISVSTALLNTSFVAAGYSAAAATPQPTTNNAADTVKLSEAQRIYQLHDQGKDISQIADSLSLSVSEVNSFLNATSGAG
jgi:DNA-binding NarL/FixJ family response regulator